jgi:DNA-binding NtrC family response regulator
MLINYDWPGNVRELKNIAEQISVLAADRHITAAEMGRFLPERSGSRLPVLAHGATVSSHDFANEREILYKLFFDMKKDVNELKKMFYEIIQNPAIASQHPGFMNDLKELHQQDHMQPGVLQPSGSSPVILHHNDEIHHHEEVEESLNIMDKEKELIEKALKKHRGKRKDASSDLGISERTLYRKLKEYDIKE